MNINFYAKCEHCNFNAISKNKWEIHLRSNKHQRNGKRKSDFNFCDICGHWCLYEYHLKIHKIISHGTIEQKKQAPFYCEHCNVAMFSNLFYDKHVSTNKHKLMVKRFEMIKNNSFNDIDSLLIEQNYMAYLSELENKLKYDKHIGKIMKISC